MAVHTYGTTNISFSSFDTWANNIASDSNVTMNNALADASPSNSNPTSASEIYNNNWFHGQLQVSTNGKVDVSGPGSYSIDNQSAGTVTLKNCNLDEGNLTLTADETAAYPHTFTRWRRDSSSGAEITTSNTLTISSGTETGTTLFYAEFS
jgi:hypothetical protein